ALGRAGRDRRSAAFLLCALRPLRRAAHPALAPGRLDSSAGGGLGRAHFVPRLDLSPHAAGEVAAPAGRRRRVRGRVHRALPPADTVSAGADAGCAGGAGRDRPIAESPGLLAGVAGTRVAGCGSRGVSLVARTADCAEGAPRVLARRARSARRGNRVTERSTSRIATWP